MVGCISHLLDLPVLLNQKWQNQDCTIQDEVISCTCQAWHVGAEVHLVSNLNCIIDFIVSMYKWEVQFVMYVVVGLAWVHRGRKKSAILHYFNCMVNKPMKKMFNLIQTMYTLRKSKFEYMWWLWNDLTMMWIRAKPREIWWWVDVWCLVNLFICCKMCVYTSLLKWTHICVMKLVSEY